MKIITEEQWLAQDIFDLFHLFVQNSKLDEEKPFICFDMQLNGLELNKKFHIEFEDEDIDFCDISPFLC